MKFFEEVYRLKEGEMDWDGMPEGAADIGLTPDDFDIDNEEPHFWPTGPEFTDEKNVIPEGEIELDNSEKFVSRFEDTSSEEDFDEQGFSTWEGDEGTDFDHDVDDDDLYDDIDDDYEWDAMDEDDFFDDDEDLEDEFYDNQGNWDPVERDDEKYYEQDLDNDEFDEDDWDD